MDSVKLADVLQLLHDDKTSLRAAFEGVCEREYAKEKLAELVEAARLRDIRLVAGMKVEYNDGRHDRSQRFGRWVAGVVDVDDAFVQVVHSAVIAVAFTDPGNVRILTDATDIRKAYADSGVDTCLTGSSSVQCYASSATGLAVLFSEDGDVLARTVVNTERRRWIRVYGDRQHAVTLRLLLRRMGYSLSRRALDDVLLPTWYLGDDEFAAPYLDGDIYTADLVDQNGYYWHVRDGGRYELRESGGRICVQDEYFTEYETDSRVPCDQCSELVEETVTAYDMTGAAVTTRQLCARCRQRYTSPTLIRCNDSVVAPAFYASCIHVWIPGRNDPVSMLASPANRRSLVELGYGTWADATLAVFDVVDQDYILKRDAIILDYVGGYAVFTHKRNHRDIVWNATHTYESLQCDVAPIGGAYILTEEAAKKAPSWLIGRLAKRAETTLDIYMDACEKGVKY